MGPGRAGSLPGANPAARSLQGGESRARLWQDRPPSPPTPMIGTRPGLRTKFVLALLLACALALLAAWLLGERLVDAARSQFGQAYARNLTQLERERILAPLSRELALAQRFAGSPLLRRMLREPGSAQRSAFFEEAGGYLQSFGGGAYFVASAVDGAYYYNERGEAFSEQPRYLLEADDPEDGWFFATLRADQPYSLNVNYDAKLKETRVWINVLVKDGGQTLGLAGAGLDLSGFLHEFIGRAEPGVLPLIVNDAGAIQAHPDPQRVALNAAEKQAPHARTLAGLLPATPAAVLAAALADSRAQPQAAVLRDLGDGRLLALTYLPQLHWHVASLVDLRAAQVIDERWLWWAGGAAGAVVLILLAGFGVSVDRLMVGPLRRLQHSAEAVAQGDYAVDLPPGRGDEIGALSRSFASMARQVQAHTAELEGKVRARTAELEASHAQVLQAHRQIDDSIRYASLIQRATLPDRELARVLGRQQHVLWKPRDVVGGDFYLFRADGDGFLLGVMDCAGHGVPGALMTMLARSAFDDALDRHGLRDPARLLQQADETLRQMLADASLTRALATSTDAGLVYVDRRRGELVFAGAAIHLYHSDGGSAGELRGSRRALGDRRRAQYANTRLPLTPGSTWCLVSDGLLDQAGGEQGWGFGSQRFMALLQASATRPLDEQAQALAAALAAYQGHYAQRDDITVLSLRLD